MIRVPTLFLDPIRCKKNIAKMAAKARRNKLAFRPHVKTHQSLDVARWLKEEGVSKITVSSLKMAAYFAQEWNDITVAFPTNILEIETINSLASKIQLNLCVENVEVLDFLEKNLNAPVGIFLKMDIGYHRTGIAVDRFSIIDQLLSQMDQTPLLQFKGFLGHAGHSYQCRSKKSIEAVHQASKEQFLLLKDRYQKQYPELILSYGDTPSCSVSEDFAGIDEIRPGNFIFYDITQNIIGSNELDEVAVAMACPVVAIHPDRNEIVVYGGGVHLSKDQIEDPEVGIIFGRVVEQKGSGWGGCIPKMHLKSLSQEHGIVSVPKEKMQDFAIGDLLWVLPVHSCMAADLMKEFHTTDGAILSAM